MPRHHVLIPAAGSGSRMGGPLPKQYLPLLGRPVIAHTVRVFQTCPQIDRIVILLHPDDTEWSDAVVASDRLHVLYCGGETRARTVLNGLNALIEYVAPKDWVLVHDAARPCLSSILLERLLVTLADHPVGGVLAVPVADTLKAADAMQYVTATVSRQGLWGAQTPQMFRYALLRQALQQMLAQGLNPTDEAEAVEQLGMQPLLVPGDSRNLKVTYTADMEMASLILNSGGER